jgi:hypothetical protein
MSKQRYEVLAKTVHGLKFERYNVLDNAREDFAHIIRNGKTPGSDLATVEAWLIDRWPLADATTDTLDYWLKQDR